MKGEITCGVPQGSTLGPLLFLLYINDIANSVPTVKIHLFADDTNFFISGKNIQNVISNCNDALAKLTDWLLANKLSLNTEKTCFSFFSRQSLNDSEISIKVNKKEIKRVPNSKYLGVIIDEDLTWAKHIDFVKNKIIRFAGMLYKIRTLLSQSILRMIYFSMIYPHILYGIEIYANTFAKHLNPLIKANNRILRIIQNKPFRTHVQELYKNFNTLPINVLFQFQILKFMHKFNHFPNFLPTIYINYFTPNSSIHHHNTRSCNDLHQQSFKKSIGQRSIKNKGVKLWNSLPVELKTITNANVFIRKVRMYLSKSEVV